MLDYIHILRFRYGKKLSCREIAETQGCGKIAINDFLKKFRESMVIQFSLRRLFEFFLACLFLLAAILRSVTTFERPSDRFFTPYALKDKLLRYRVSFPQNATFSGKEE